MVKTQNGVVMRRVLVAVSLLLIPPCRVAAKVNKGADDDGLTKKFAVVAKTEADLNQQAAGANPGSQQQKQLLAKAAEARQQGNAILGSCPTCPALLTKGSGVAMTRGDMGAAQTLADQAVNAAQSMATPNPGKLMGALNQRGLVALKTGDYQKAMDDARGTCSLSSAQD